MSFSTRKRYNTNKKLTQTYVLSVSITDYIRTTRKYRLSTYNHRMDTLLNLEDKVGQPSNLGEMYQITLT
jgi:hypothetical protein